MEIVARLDSMRRQRDHQGSMELSCGGEPHRAPTTSVLEDSKVCMVGKWKERSYLIFFVLMKLKEGVLALLLLGVWVASVKVPSPRWFSNKCKAPLTSKRGLYLRQI